MNKIIKVHPEDNIAVALVDLKKDGAYELNGEIISIKYDTKAKHKISLIHLNKGASVFMYGVLVGKAVQEIEKGEVLTTSNLAHAANTAYRKDKKNLNWNAPNVSKWKDRTFNGYYRADGQVGTANIWLFFPLVFCENRNINVLKDVFETEFSRRKAPIQKQFLRDLVAGKNNTEITSQKEKSEVSGHKNIEVRFITHQGGCGGIRQDSAMLAKLLAGYVNNPNVAGATVLSLGCQNLQIDIFKDALNNINPNFKKPLLIYEQQQMGTVDNMLNTIISESFEGIKKAMEIKREPAPLSKLKLGLECGGSDGFSGISANPALGHVSDIIAALGGSPILSEFPELCGVEQELVDRCDTVEDAEKFLNLINAYEKAAEASGSGFDMNPSPGNIKDGLITDAMKSAGAAKKGGSSPIKAVLDYGEYVTEPGLNLLCTPGNDVESTTGMVGSGANIVVFTTGLGTPTGNPIAPVLKLSSNTVLAKKMPDIIDIDAGGVINGTKTIEKMGEELLEHIIAVASGEKQAKADVLGQEDFIPWKRGVSL